ncbi:MAG: WD40/YVTN/BNR-like repeat-containing protein, partial [Candidatus Binataceae bacterium]
SITFDPHDSNTIYVGVEEGGAFRSRDRGQSFEPLSQNIYADIHCLVADPHDPHRLYATTGGGFYVSATDGATWTRLKGLSRSYAVPLIALADGVIYTAAAGGPPPTWSMDQLGADALMFRSPDHGVGFTPVVQGDGNAHPTRGMVMRLVAQPDNDQVLFGALSDGTVVKIDEHAATVTIVAEKLPPAYDLAVLP